MVDCESLRKLAGIATRRPKNLPRVFLLVGIVGHGWFLEFDEEGNEVTTPIEDLGLAISETTNVWPPQVRKAWEVAERCDRTLRNDCEAWNRTAISYADLLREALDYIDAYRKQVDAIGGIDGANDLYTRINDRVAEVQQVTPNAKVSGAGTASAGLPG